MAVLDPGREREVLAQKIALTDAPAQRMQLTTLFQSIMAISRRQQRELMAETQEGGDFQALEALLGALSTSPPSATQPKVVYQGEPGALMLMWFSSSEDRTRIPSFTGGSKCYVKHSLFSSFCLNPLNSLYLQSILNFRILD